MTEKIYVVIDNGHGDGGKGSVVHKIAIMTRAHTVLKVGGGQGCHGVQDSEGRDFAFSHWGCGTFRDIKTHITSRMIIIPIELLSEARTLRYGGVGIHDPFSLLTVDEEALCATPYDRISSHVKELARGKNPRGTIGTGVGEAYRYSQKYPDQAIRVRDLVRPDLRDRLIRVRKQIQHDLASVIQGEFLPEDLETLEKEVILLNDDGYLDFIEKQFREAGQQMKIVDHGYLGRVILPQKGVAVVESSHGVLTDHYHGFHPHTSAIRTLPYFIEAMLRDAGYEGPIVNIGIFRAYAIGHGAKPMPTDDLGMAEQLFPKIYRDENRWRGGVRVGAIDLVMLRYAIEVCGGPSAFGGLAVTCFDHVVGNGEWRICKKYNSEDTKDRTFFTPSGEIKVRRGTDDEQLEYQEKLGKQLMNCRPEITTLKIPECMGREELYAFCASVLEKELGVPVKMISFGPTELDKICK